MNQVTPLEQLAGVPPPTDETLQPLASAAGPGYVILDFEQSPFFPDEALARVEAVHDHYAGHYQELQILQQRLEQLNAAPQRYTACHPPGRKPPSFGMLVEQGNQTKTQRLASYS